MQSAGVGLVSFFETQRNSEKDQRKKKALHYVAENLKKGFPLSKTLERSGLLPVFDIPIIESGEKSGNLTRVCDILSKNYELSNQALKTVRGGLTKPFFTFTAALFLPSFPDLFLGKVTLVEYISKNLSIMAVAIIITVVIYRYFMLAYYTLEAARTKHLILSSLPYLSGLERKMVLEKFCSSLSLMLEAGLPILEALALAGKTSADPEIQFASQRIIKNLKSGVSLPKSFASEAIFTEEIKNSILLGNESGKVPHFLGRSASLLKKDINSGIEKISKVIPVIVYCFVIIFVAWTIISFNINRINEIDSIFGTDS
jgi:type IV pilus assembly protein PilC